MGRVWNARDIYVGWRVGVPLAVAPFLTMTAAARLGE